MSRFSQGPWHLWLVLVGVVATVGLSASPLSATTMSRSPTAVARGIAAKYVAALNRLDASALDPILDKNVVEVDWAYGNSGAFHGAAELKAEWADMFRISGETGWRGSVCCAGPNWAAVTYRWWGSTNPLTNKPFSMKGLSLLEIKSGTIVRETIYWDVPGRSAGVAPAVGKQYAAALGKLQPQTLATLYGEHAVQVDKARNQEERDAGTIVHTWQQAFGDSTATHWRGSLCCAGPRMRMDNGTTRSSWAVVDWRWSQSTVHKPITTNGVSILTIYKGKIVRETIYYDIPGR